MKRIGLFFTLFFILTGCFDKDEFTSVLSIDPLSKEGEVFISETGEEYWMGCDKTYCYGFSGGAPESDQTLTDLIIPANLPASFDLSSFLPEVGNQGQIG